MPDLERGEIGTLTQWMFKRKDGSEVLLDLWWKFRDGFPFIDGALIAERDQHGAVWGPPTEGARQSDDNA